jgi:hypothetical protein
MKQVGNNMKINRIQIILYTSMQTNQKIETKYYKKIANLCDSHTKGLRGFLVQI